MKRSTQLLATLAGFAAASAIAQTRVEMNLVDIKGVGASVGTVEFAPAQGGNGVVEVSTPVAEVAAERDGYSIHRVGRTSPRAGSRFS